MIEIPPQVMAKLQKIMNLANNAGATEGEVMSALGRAREMLQQYDLSLDEFSSVLKDKDDTSVVEESVFQTANLKTWIVTMLHGVAKLTNTNYFYTKKSYKDGKNVTEHIFLGSKTDIGIAAAISSYLYYAAKGFADIYTENNHKLQNASEKRIFRSNFYNGFSDRVFVYARDLRKEEERKAKEEQAKNNNERGLVVIWNSLVVKKEKAIAEFKDERSLSLKLKKQNIGKRGRYNSDGYEKGKSTADTILNNKPKGYIENS